jgi:hypothetical protein
MKAQKIRRAERLRVTAPTEPARLPQTPIPKPIAVPARAQRQVKLPTDQPRTAVRRWTVVPGSQHEVRFHHQKHHFAPNLNLKNSALQEN